MSIDSTPPAATTPTDEKASQSHIEHITTHDRVPGHENYYEKNGLRTYGDGEDHDHEPPMSFKRLMSLVAMAFIWTGSQIPVYIFGAIPPYIYADIGGVDRYVHIHVYYSLLSEYSLAFLQMDLVRARQPLGPSWCMSFRRFTFRPHGPSLCLPLRLGTGHARHDCVLDRESDERLYWRYGYCRSWCWNIRTHCTGRNI